MLAREGYEVATAKDGVDALQQLQDTKPDCILLDVEMPRMDGFEFARNVRADEATRAIPIIMITSRTADKHRNHALEIGVNEYMGKPYQEEQLLALIKRYTERMSGINVGAYSQAGGALFVTVVGLPSIVATDWTAVSAPVWAAIIYSGIGALVVGNLIWYYGVSRLGPTRVSMFSNLQPLVALAVAWMVLGEVPTVWQGLGAASIMTGLFVTRG